MVIHDRAAGIDCDRRRFLGTAAMTIAAAHLGTFSTVNASEFLDAGVETFAFTFG